MNDTNQNMGPATKAPESRSVVAAGVALAVALFLTVNLFAGPALRSLRADLTEQKLYTLSDGTRNIVGNLDEPITLRFFFPKDLMGEAAQGLIPYGERVQEMLDQYVVASDGMVQLEVLDPEPFSEAEELAASFGLQGLQASRQGERLYFGLVGTNSVDDEETIGFFDPRREAKLEYEISELVERLKNPDRKVVGLVTSLQLRGGQTMVPNQFGQPQPQELPPWPILDAIERLFEVRDLDPATLTEIPEDVDVLMLVQPKTLTPEATYAIDQWCLSGGAVAAFVDPFAFFDPDARGAGPGADLGPGQPVLDLLAAWGVDASVSEAVGDETSGQTVRGADGSPARLPLFFKVGTDTLDGDDFLMESLNSLTLMSPMALRAAADLPDGVEVSELFSTTPEGGGSIATDMFALNLDLGMIATMFAPSGEAQPLAVRVRGSVRSAFPDGPPSAGDEVPTDDETTGDETAEDPEDAEAPADDAEHLAAATSTFNALVFGDVDMLHESLLFDQIETPFGVARRQNSNASLLVGALESLGGSRDLISLRGREPYARPFDRKDELQRSAEERFKAKEDELQRKLEAADARLAQLQSEKAPEDALLLSDAQQDEILKFEEERIQTRRELRQVNRDLRADIDALGTRLKFLNVFAIPLVLTALVLATVLLRRGRRRSAA
ncbi:MAG: GldG family protein [Planctomycetota bacterium]